MPLIWCSISGHGFGHAAQVVPVLNELGKQVLTLRAILRTTVPASFFGPRLTVEWTLSPAEQDVGCIQQGPLNIDVAGTWAAHERFHAGWEAAVDAEVAALRASRADLVLSDVSHLAVEVGRRAGLRTAGLCNLSWDLVLDGLMSATNDAHRRVLDHIRLAYRKADLMIRIAPGLPMSAFQTIVDVGPVVGPLQPPIPQLRSMLKMEQDERLVLVGFGGVQLEAVPFEHMDRIQGYRFLFDGPVPCSCARVYSMPDMRIPFNSALASCDAIVTKPGYATVVEAVALQKPVVYVRRYNFADEEPLVNYLHRYGRAAELSIKDFESGRWKPSLDRALSAPSPQELAPAPSGAIEAAARLAPYLAKAGA
jgi:hypothetical protein